MADPPFSKLYILMSSIDSAATVQSALNANHDNEEKAWKASPGSSLGNTVWKFTPLSPSWSLASLNHGKTQDRQSKVGKVLFCLKSETV